MESLNNIISVPSWAYDFCYYYFFVAVLVVVTTVVTIVQLVFLPAGIKKVAPVSMTILMLILSAIVTAVLGMMQFWICRSALKPAKATKAIKENFAVKCQSPEDCKAVMGPSSTCECGGRGLCAGCVMNTNTEPEMLENGMPMAPFGLNTGAEGFTNPMPKTKAAANHM